MPQFSVSTWSLHRALGAMYQPDESGRLMASEPWGPGTWTLMDVPAELARREIAHLEICHFHLPRTDAAYLDQLRKAIDGNGVNLFSVLIDAGDITHPDPARRRADTEWIRGWIETASRLGSRNVRVIAGDARPDDLEARRLSAEGLRDLSEFAEARGVRVMTENFRAISSRPDALNAILDETNGRVGLCADFGNYGGPTKYDDLAAIMPRADSVHAKADFSADGAIDRSDLNRCLEVTQRVGFDGPYTLIFEGPQPEWDGLAVLQSEIAGSLSVSAAQDD